MTRPAAARRTPTTRRRGLALAAVSGLLALTAVACGDETGDSGGSAGDDPAASTSTSGSATTSPGDSASASSPASTDPTPSQEPDPVPSPVVDKAVKAAIRDDFPALVPAGVPSGWTVVSASYDKARGGVWRIDLTDATGGPVQLVQAKASTKALVQQNLGKATPAGALDFGEYGTGTWQAFSGDAGFAIAKKLLGTGVVVVALDQATVSQLAEQLLTAEDGAMPDAG